jgi:hypothetical protein
VGKARKPVYVTDDEQGSSASENEYELGSFVCPDEEDLSFASESAATTAQHNATQSATPRASTWRVDLVSGQVQS